MPRKLMAEVPLDSLPVSCRITGRALKKAGAREFCGHVSEGFERVVVSFRDESPASVNEKLQGRHFDRVEVLSIRFV
jgi:hypothetical protein